MNTTKAILKQPRVNLIRHPLKQYTTLRSLSRHYKPNLSYLQFDPRLIRRNYATIKTQGPNSHMSKGRAVDDWKDLDDGSWSFSSENDQEKLSPVKAPISKKQEKADVKKLDSSPLRAHNAPLLEGVDFDESFSDDQTASTNESPVNMKKDEQVERKFNGSPIREKNRVYEDLFDSDFPDSDLSQGKAPGGGDMKRIKIENSNSTNSDNTNRFVMKTSKDIIQESIFDDDDFFSDDDMKVLELTEKLSRTPNNIHAIDHIPIDQTIPNSSKPKLLAVDLNSQGPETDPRPSPEKDLYPPDLSNLNIINKPDLQHHDSTISISAPETSSPAHHRTATTGPRVPLFPNMKNYQERFPPVIPPPPFELPRMSTNLNSQPLPEPPNFDIPLTIETKREPKPRDSRGRKFGQNAEMILMTQKPSCETLSTRQKRNANTDIDQARPPSAKSVTPFMLSEEQQNVIDLILKGASIFYTGSAGTGKSVLLRSLIKKLRQKHSGMENAVAVTASTGLAAVNIGGVTLHSFAGIGLGKDEPDVLVKKIRRSRKALNKWKSVKVLIIDEISMIDGILFDKLDEIACTLRRNDEPFGGIQVICCGDFFQLPPVSKDDSPPSLFAFECESWRRTLRHTIILRKVFRQKGDLEFIDMLNQMRLGKVTEDACKKWRSLERPLPIDDGIEAAELYSTRGEVERANNLRLRSLKTEELTYQAIDGGTLQDQDARERLLSNFIAPRTLVLKQGAQVMMLKNLDEGLVNGSLGKVVGFLDKETYMTYQKMNLEPDFDLSVIEEQIEENGKIREHFGHLSPETEQHQQQQQVDVLEDSVFDFLLDANSKDPDVSAEIQQKKKLMKKLSDSSTGSKLPLVKFLTPEGQSRTVLVSPETWTVEDEKQQPLVSRVQIPLMLAWALSIHKSQGQTLPRVRVNLKRVFEKGQVYVALSRAVKREGLQVLNFDENKVYAHDKVINFYNELLTIDDVNKAKNEQQESGDEEEVKAANTTDPGMFNSGLTKSGIYRDQSKRMKPKHLTSNFNNKAIPGQPTFQRPFSANSTSNNKFAPPYQFQPRNANDKVNCHSNGKTKKPVFQRRSMTTPALTGAKPAKHMQIQLKRYSSDISERQQNQRVKKFEDIGVEDIETSYATDDTTTHDGGITKIMEESKENLSFIDMDSGYGNSGASDDSYRPD